VHGQLGVVVGAVVVVVVDVVVVGPPLPPPPQAAAPMAMPAAKASRARRRMLRPSTSSLVPASKLRLSKLSQRTIRAMPLPRTRPEGPAGGGQ
jgi:hypothetical protein